jgi:hypothetical protein
MEDLTPQQQPMKRMQKDAKDEELGKRIRAGDEKTHGERRGQALEEDQRECAMQQLVTL